VAVVGAGALGTLLAALFSRRAPVVLFGRGESLRRIRARGGVRVAGRRGGFYAVEARAGGHLPRAALVLVAVKAYDLEAALRELAPRLGDSHLVVVLQNGLGVRSLAERVLRRPVTRAVTFLAAATLEPGIVAFNAVGKTYFPAEGAEVLGAWRASRLPGVRTPDLLTYVWRKLAINAVINPLSAVLGVENGRLLPLRRTTRGLVEELAAVARREGQVLDPVRTAAKVRASMVQTSTNVSSMLQDVRAGRPTEIDWINGAVVRLADRHGLAVPQHRQLIELVRFVERAASLQRSVGDLSRRSTGRRPRR
jgi:2-dehydropantoate 2-reductase